MTPIINIKVSNYFQLNFQIIGYGLLFGSFLSFQANILASLILLVIGIVITSSHYRLKIDNNKKVFFEYLWILGFKNGISYRYKKAEIIRIKESKNHFQYVSKYADDLTSFGQPRKGHEYVYKAYIEFSGQEEKAYLGEKKQLKNIQAKCSEIVKILNIKISPNI